MCWTFNFFVVEVLRVFDSTTIFMKFMGNQSQWDLYPLWNLIEIGQRILAGLWISVQNGSVMAGIK